LFLLQLAIIYIILTRIADLHCCKQPTICLDLCKIAVVEVAAVQGDIPVAPEQIFLYLAFWILAGFPFTYF
jgi:hypothetical protein